MKKRRRRSMLFSLANRAATNDGRAAVPATSQKSAHILCYTAAAQTCEPGRFSTLPSCGPAITLPSNENHHPADEKKLTTCAVKWGRNYL